MKDIARTVFVAMLVCVSLVSCQQVAEDSTESRSMVTLKVKATTIEQEIQGWEPVDADDITINGKEVKSRAEQEAVSRMAFFLLDEEGKKVLAQEKSNTSNDYLNLYVEAPKGAYQLVAFGHNGTADASIDANAIITPPSGKLTDSFLYYKEIELNEESESEQSITLDRCVSKFSLKHTDAIPEGTATVEFVVTGAAKVLNAKTGLGDESEEQAIVINIPASAVGTKNNSFAFYTFLTSGESKLKIVATSKDADDAVLATYTFEDVEMEVNMQTIYSGAFFHADQKIGASFNTEWKPDKKVGF